MKFLPGWDALGAVFVGAVGACAFPLVIAPLGREPCLDGGPRELCVGVLAAALYAWVSGEPGGRPIWRCGLAGCGFFATLIDWLDIAMTRFGGLAQWQALPLVLLLVGLCACFYGMLPVCYGLVRRLGLWGPLSFAVAVVVLEWLRGGAFLGFPWGVWGYSQVRNVGLLGWARLLGVYGVSFWLALGSAAAVEVWRRRSGLALWVVAAGGVWAIGWALLPTVTPESVALGLRVGVVQANIPQDIKNDAFNHRESIGKTYRDLSVMAAQRGRVELMIWPEGAWPSYVADDSTMLPIAALGTPLLLGAGSYLSGPPMQVFNSAFLLDATGAVLGNYHKAHLVPFGEYVPWRWLLPVDKFVPGTTDFSPGTSMQPLGAQRLGVLICYDGVFPEIARAQVRAGARLLVNMTNDAWYGISSAPYQHLDFYVLRAVETGRWVVRAANSGVSVFVDPRGALYDATPLGEAATVVRTVPTSGGVTPYVRFGDGLVVVCLGCLLAAGMHAAATFCYRRFQSASTPPPPPSDL